MMTSLDSLTFLHLQKQNRNLVVNIRSSQMYMTCMISSIQTMSANTKIHHSFICINTFLKRTIQKKSSGICISCLFQRSTSNSQRKKTCSSSDKDCRKNWTRKNHNWFKLNMTLKRSSTSFFQQRTCWKHRNFHRTQVGYATIVNIKTIVRKELII